MIQSKFENLIQLLLMVVTDQLHNLMMEAGFKNLNHLFLMVTQTRLVFILSLYLLNDNLFCVFLILVVDYMGGSSMFLMNVIPNL